MSYLPHEPTTFINIKLTDTGRRMLSLGKLTFKKAILSDREIDYSIDRTGYYNILNNRVLAPKDDEPTFENLDGSTPINLGSTMVNSSRLIVTATTSSLTTNGVGFYTGTTSTNFALDTTKMLGQGIISYSASTSMPTGGTQIYLFSGGSYFPQTGDLVYIPWQPIQYSGYSYTSSTVVEQNKPTLRLWYRVYSADSTNSIITLDRPTPDFGSSPTNQNLNVYFYPYNGVESYYGSAATVDARVWNMSIVRTSSEIGTDSSISGYTTYGSIEYNGTRAYLGFSAETRAIGIVHYTNEYTGNTYAEQLVEGTVKLHIPDLMWYKYAATPGAAVNYGLTLYDAYGSSTYDSVARTTYKELRDGISSSSTIVGRVYHKLKIIVITDPELLTALSYKSNRNYTLPPVIANQTTYPKYPLTTSDATGLCKSGYTYFVTYLVENNSSYASGSSYGYPQALHCGYVQKISGQYDIYGNPQYLAVNFPAGSFPYLRSSLGMQTYSGTGWNANRVQLLVQEVSDIYGYNINSVPADGWVKVSNGVGNGIYTGDTTDLTIDPLKLSAQQFIISREDYDSGTTYVLDSDFYSYNDSDSNGLTFGDEAFFFGNLETSILATVFKTTIVVTAKATEFNSTANPTFDGTLDDNIYITEIGILDESGNLVGIGKPTYPIKKNIARFLQFQLEIDF